MKTCSNSGTLGAQSDRPCDGTANDQRSSQQPSGECILPTGLFLRPRDVTESGSESLVRLAAPNSHWLCQLGGSQRTPGSLPPDHTTQTERGGFEPPVRLPAHSISSAAQSTTLPPLLCRPSPQERPQLISPLDLRPVNPGNRVARREETGSYKSETPARGSVPSVCDFAGQIRSEC